MAAVDTATKEMEALHVGQNEETKADLIKEGKTANSNGVVPAAQSSPPEDDDEAQADDPSQDGAPEAAKKKKKKNKSKKKKGPLQQTDPPSIPVDEFFPSGEFPEGEIQQYKDE